MDTESFTQFGTDIIDAGNRDRPIFLSYATFLIGLIFAIVVGVCGFGLTVTSPMILALEIGFGIGFWRFMIFLESKHYFWNGWGKLNFFERFDKGPSRTVGKKFSIKKNVFGQKNCKKSQKS